MDSHGERQVELILGRHLARRRGAEEHAQGKGQDDARAGPENAHGKFLSIGSDQQMTPSMQDAAWLKKTP